MHLRNILLAILFLFFLGCFQITEWGEKIQTDTTDSNKLVGLARSQFDVKNYEEAGKLLQKAIDVDPSNAQAYKWFAMVCGEIAVRGYDEKIYENTNYFRKLAILSYMSLHKAVKLAPDDNEIRLLRGKAGVAMPFFVKKLDQGIADLNEVLKSDASEAVKNDARYWLGRAYEKRAISYWIDLVNEDANSEASKAVFESMRPAVKRFDISKYNPPVLAIDFILGFRDELAPQTAVWVEDHEGKFVKTIYVSGFSAHAKESQKRLPEWAKSSEFIDVDSVSGASINIGHYIYTWDLKDHSGKEVKPGEYVVNVEVAYWPSWQYQSVSANVSVGNEKDRTVVETGKFVPYLEVNYIPDGGK